MKSQVYVHGILIPSNLPAGHSTETALLHVLDSMYTAIDGNKITAIIALDISRASDSFMTFCTLISIYIYVYISAALNQNNKHNKPLHTAPSPKLRFRHRMSGSQIES